MTKTDWTTLAGGDLADAYLSTYGTRPTAAHYGMSLKWFLQWCANHDLDVRELRPFHFDSLRREMLELWKVRTIALRQSAITGFYRYLVERGELEVSPIPDGWRVKVDRDASEAPALNSEELGRFKDAANTLGGKAAVVVLLITDLYFRPQQIESARVGDFPVSPDGSIEVTGDGFGSLYRTKTLRAEDAAVLRQTVDGRPADELLLHTKYETPLNRSAIQRLLEKVSKKAGVKRVTASPLRNAALVHSIGGFKGELRPARFRAAAAAGEVSANTEVHPVAFAKQLLALSDVLLDEAHTRPVAPVVLSGTAVEYFLRRLALQAGSTSKGGGVEAWASALKSLGVITSLEKKEIDVWAGLRNIAVHDDDTSPLTLRDARKINVEFLEFLDRHEASLT